MATQQFLTFGQALDALVSHRAVTIARDGWDGVLFLEDQPSPYMHVTGREPKRHPVLVYAGGKEWEHHPGWVIPGVPSTENAGEEHNWLKAQAPKPPN